MSTIYVLWIRQLKRYIRSRSRIIGSLGQPIMFLIALGYGFSAIFRQAGAGSYIQFLGPGIVAQTIMFTAIFNGSELIWDRQFGFLKETMVAPVSRINIMLGRTFGGATVAVIQGIIVFFLSMIVGFRPHDWVLFPITVLVMFLIGLLFTALGTAVASKMSDFQGFQLIINFLVMPMFFLSGALFPLQGLPRWLDAVTKINPLTYSIDALRRTMIDSSHYSLSHDLWIIASVVIAIIAVGSYLFSKIEA